MQCGYCFFFFLPILYNCCACDVKKQDLSHISAETEACLLLARFKLFRHDIRLVGLCVSVTLNRRNVSICALWLHRGRSIFSWSDRTRCLGVVFPPFFFFTECCNFCHIRNREMEGGIWEATGMCFTVESTKRRKHKKTLFLKRARHLRLCKIRRKSGFCVPVFVLLLTDTRRPHDQRSAGVCCMARCIIAVLVGWS